jgi:hypothetical protein
MKTAFMRDVWWIALVAPMLAACGDWGWGGRGDQSADLNATPDACPIDVPLGIRSEAATWPPRPDPDASGAESQQEPEEDIACIMSGVRWALVEVDAIIRDYRHPDFTAHLTVYRLRVIETLYGGDLADIAYAWRTTGYVYRDGTRYRDELALVEVGWVGLARLGATGIDVIRSTALSGNDYPTAEVIVPARVQVMSFFLRRLEPDGDTYLLPETGRVRHLWGGDTITLDDLHALLESAGPETCRSYEYWRGCGFCDTAQGCATVGDHDPWPCRCNHHHPDCKELPPEDPLRSCLYDPYAAEHSG